MAKITRPVKTVICREIRAPGVAIDQTHNQTLDGKGEQPAGEYQRVPPVGGLGQQITSGAKQVEKFMEDFFRFGKMFQHESATDCVETILCEREMFQVGDAKMFFVCGSCDVHADSKSGKGQLIDCPIVSTAGVQK